MDSQVEYFPEEQGERLHEYIKVLEQRYQERWDENMMADYCWKNATTEVFRSGMMVA